MPWHAGGGDHIELSVDYPPGKSRTFAFADRPIRVYEGTVKLAGVLR